MTENSKQVEALTSKKLEDYLNAMDKKSDSLERNLKDSLTKIGEENERLADRLTQAENKSNSYEHSRLTAGDKRKLMNKLLQLNKLDGDAELVQLINNDDDLNFLDVKGDSIKLTTTNSNISTVLSPTVYPELFKVYQEVSNVRQYANIVPCPGASCIVPLTDHTNKTTDAAYIAETATGATGDLNASGTTLTPRRLFKAFSISNLALLSPTFDILSAGLEFNLTRMAYVEGREMTIGDGTGLNPQGFASGLADIAKRNGNSTTPGTVTFLELANLTNQVRGVLDLAFYCNNKTFSTISNQLVGQNIPLHASGNVRAPFIWHGFPVRIMPDMEDMAASDQGTRGNALVFGSLRQGYSIAEKQGIVLKRDDYTGILSSTVTFANETFNTGRITNPSALYLLKA